jgi:DNA (cytosine-5)-methyltransferase 1
MTLRLLDLCCGVGGAARGYSLAGFTVLGVDLAHDLDYPYGYVVDDAMRFLRRSGRFFDAIHASPPCQQHSSLTKGTNAGREYVDLIAPMRRALNRSGKPYVIENVVGAPLRRDLMLCGEMFGLNVIRHRVFELGGWQLDAQIEHVPHRGRVAAMRHSETHEGPYFGIYGDGGGKGTTEQWQDALRINWTTNRAQLAQAIPPAYTQWIGTQLAEHLTQKRAA